MASDSATLEGLASTISSTASIVTDFLRQGGHAQPSFSVDGPTTFPQDPPEHVQVARSELIAAARQLSFLAAWPTEAVQAHSLSGAHDISSLRWLYHYDIASFVPLRGSISMSDLATQANVSENRLGRFLRHAMTSNFFAEPSPNQVAHTSQSKLLATSDFVKGIVGHQSEIVFPSTAKVVEAHETFGESQAATQTAFNFAFQTDERYFPWLAQDPRRAKMFAASMKGGAQKGSPFSSDGLVEGIEWDDFGDGTFVDVGGSQGHVSLAIAAKAPRLKFIVQDQPEMISQGEANLPADMKPRLEFMCHDFFGLNPVAGADVYLLRYILHDWPDEDAVRILRGITPCMKPTSRLIISEIVCDPPTTLSPMRERQVRTMDLIMMTLYNSLERTLEQWEALIKKADPKLSILKAERPPRSALSNIEIVKES